MGPLELVNLSLLMDRTAGRPEIIVGLIDGPVALEHPDLKGQRVRAVSETAGAACTRANSLACTHGTSVAGILCARRGSSGPAICPGCTLLVRPIFPEAAPANGHMPSTTPEELARAILETVDAGARVLNLSAALEQPSSRGWRVLTEALDHAARRGVMAVAAAGNQGTLGSTAITRHPWVIPVVACDLRGRPLPQSNLARSIGRHGLRAPGESVTSLGTGGNTNVLNGTSAATPFVTGAIALIWSEFPNAHAARVKSAVLLSSRDTRHALVPPLFDAWAAYQAMASHSTGG